MSWAENVSPTASRWMLRFVVTAVVLAAAAIMVVTIPQLHLIPGDLERRFVKAELNLIFSAYAGVLALAVAWRVGGQSEGRHLALLLGYVAACMALSVVPSGEPESWRQITFGICWMGAIVEGFKFWTTFPRTMKEGDVRGLLARAPRTGWLPWVDRVTARATAALVGTLWGKVAFTVAALGFSYRLVRTGAYRFNILSDPTALAAQALPSQVVLDLMGALVILVIVGVAWTGFRLASDDERKRVLWIVFAQLAVAGFTVTSLILGLLGEITGSPVIMGMGRILHTFYHPAVWFVDLTGFAVAIFYSGAFDLRPLINKTTVYGGLFLALTFVFATVEEVAETLLTQRLDVPEGMGAWMGAATIAVAMGPIRTRLEQFIKGLGDALEKDLDSDDGTESA